MLHASFNGTTTGNWLKTGHGIATDTTGTAADTWSAGFPIYNDAVLSDIKIATQGSGALTCTLKIWMTKYAAGKTEIFNESFSVPALIEFPDSTIAVDSLSVLSFWIGGTSNVSDFQLYGSLFEEKE
jgi:hypothetical protein